MRNIIAVIRFVVFLAFTLGIYAVWYVGAFFIPNKPFWRQLIFKNWSRGFARIARMKLEIIGTPPKPPFFLVCNHLSYTDIPALRLAADGNFVAKSEIKDWFVAGRIIRDMGAIFIDRRNKRDILRAGNEITKRLDEGEGVIIFPEGTSTKGEEILPFNSSFLEFAAKTNLSVSYASISYKTPVNEPSASDAVCWWDDTVFLDHLLKLFSLTEFTAVINFGEMPISNPNRKELAHELREKVKEKFIPVI